MQEEKRFITGEVMLREGETGDVAYLIVSGRVSITKNSPQGVIRLTTMGPGQMVGEISLIDCKPRIATAVALEPVSARVIRKDQFDRMLRSNPDMAFQLLRVLADRLRDAHDTILSIQSGHSAAFRSQAGSASGSPTPSPTEAGATPAQAADRAAQAQPDMLKVMTMPQREPPKQKVMVTTIDGASDAALVSLEGEPLVITEYPYLIGRDSRSSSADNDFWIADNPPYQVSRNHLAIILDRNEILITDRGSHLGFGFDGERYGQGEDEERTAYAAPGEHTLVIGGEDSPYRYTLMVEEGVG